MSVFSKYEQYIHHNIPVMVRKSLRGKHRDYCLCWDCRHFMPGDKLNCPAAKELHEFCQKWGMTTPVFECPNFVEK
jgi:hypothetical protein